MLHELGCLTVEGSNIYTYLYIGKRFVQWLGQLCALAISPMRRHLPIRLISRNYRRPSGRRQPDARSIDEPSPATPRLLEPVVVATLILCRMRHAARTAQQAEAAEARGFQRPARGYQPRRSSTSTKWSIATCWCRSPRAYRTVLPDPVRDSLRDFLRNLREPLIFVNDALQGEFERAGQTFARFTLNSTIGRRRLCGCRRTVGTASLSRG